MTIIGIHLGYPWTEEMISVCTKHPNVYMAGDAYAPKHWGASAVHYANTYGQDKFMFGTDWWVIDPERAVAEVADLNFRKDRCGRSCGTMRCGCSTSRPERRRIAPDSAA